MKHLLNNGNLVILIKTVFGFIFSYLISVYSIPYLIKLAHHHGITDKPDNRLKTHAKPISYLGGIGIYLGFLCAFLLILPFDNRTYLVTLGTTLLLFLGLLDDLMPLKPGQKFIGQTIVALYFLKMGFHLKEQFFFALPNIGISFLWLVTMMNAINLIDVADGVAASNTIISSFGFLFCALIFGATNTVLLLSCFIGAVLGFLYYNKPKATIYMGDAGSLWIGGMLATIPFLLHWSKYNYWGMLVVPLILAIPLAEISLLILLRAYKRIPIYRGSADHHALRLQRKHWSLLRIILLDITITSILIALPLAFISNNLSLSMLIINATLIMLVWYVIVLF